MARTFLVLFALGLVACTSHVSNMQAYVPGLGKTNPFHSAMLVGDVKGGSSLLYQAGVTAGEYKEALERSLRSASALAPDESAARYRIDVAVDFTLADGTSFEDREVAAVVTYSIYRIADGQKIAEETIRETSVARGLSLGTQIGAAVVGNTAPRTSTAFGQAKFAYESAARDNIRDFIFDLTTRKLTDPSAPS